MRAEVDLCACRQVLVQMASQELKSFLGSIHSGYLEYAHAIHEGEFTSQAELGAADRSDLQALGIPKGAAGLIIATARGASPGDIFIALLLHRLQPSCKCTAFN